MYILSVKSSTEQGAYAVEDEEGKRVIFLFEDGLLTVKLGKVVPDHHARKAYM